MAPASDVGRRHEAWFPVRRDRARTALVAIKDPVSITDLHATIMTAMGISPKTRFDIENRPFYVTEDGKGQAVKDLFA